MQLRDWLSNPSHFIPITDQICAVDVSRGVLKLDVGSLASARYVIGMSERSGSVIRATSELVVSLSHRTSSGYVRPLTDSNINTFARPDRAVQFINIFACAYDWQTHLNGMWRRR